MGPKLLAVTKFAPEGFTEWVMEVRKKKNGKGEEREIVEPHPVARRDYSDEANEML